MQVKIIIGTAAFMLTMIVVGFVALREPARMTAFSEAFAGRSIENGAEIFVNNCSTCHGINGRAQECFDAATGEPIGCKGRPLNNADLLCGTHSPRMEAMGWTGSKFGFIESTVTSGRPWNGMPTWGQQFGGPLQENQVNDVALFVLNWENEELCAQPTAEPVEWPATVAGLPEGNPDNGAQLYATTFGCQACHGDPTQEGTNAVGPWLGNIAEVGAQRKEGYTAADYIYESELNPNAFIAPDCPNGPCAEPSAMPNDFATRMTQQDLADIISYLLGTSQFESSTEVELP
ncbi:MAG TPA: cytochrome c [Candidatus Binatia bacterium]|nr:cytochrome c [Candidatus Binatia bacterium]